MYRIHTETILSVDTSLKDSQGSSGDTCWRSCSSVIPVNLCVQQVRQTSLSSYNPTCHPGWGAPAGTTVSLENWHRSGTGTGLEPAKCWSSNGMDVMVSHAPPGEHPLTEAVGRSEREGQRVCSWSTGSVSRTGLFTVTVSRCVYWWHKRLTPDEHMNLM